MAVKKTSQKPARKPVARAAARKSPARAASRKTAPKAAAKGTKKPRRGRPTLSPNGRVGSNISLRMPPELYGYLKKTGKGWQTRVVRHLMAEMDRKAAWMKG